MRIESMLTRQTGTGLPLCIFRLKNSSGAYVELTNWGARWLAAAVPDATGRLENVLLRPSRLWEDNFYMGAVVGRFANRIALAQFTLDGTIYHLEKNDGENSNHGGWSGFHQKLWNWSEQKDGVTFTVFSPGGEGGYPGNVQVTVTYRWNERNELRIDYRGRTDRTTYLNLTNHAYFNLSGKGEKITRHILRIPSHTILDTTKDFIPTCLRTDVYGTPFDFTEGKAIGKDLYTDHIQLRRNKGYNHCYILKSVPSDTITEAACLLDPDTGRTLTVETDLPSVLLYTAGYYFRPDTAVCLETLYYPDTPSHPDFPSCIIRPGQEYRQTTIYRFGIRE
ncbi:MAG: galactose mutarotase [Paraprevotella sp.]|nr:galactose mutarotase [Paraprevotella sp.]